MVQCKVETPSGDLEIACVVRSSNSKILAVISARVHNFSEEEKEVQCTRKAFGGERI